MDLAGVLHHLEDAQLIRLGDEKDRTGSFRHVLIQESAHDSLLRPERRRLHQEVGETLEQSFSGRLDDVAWAWLRRRWSIIMKPPACSRRSPWLCPTTGCGISSASEQTLRAY